MRHTDYLVIGSGVAGLATALQLAGRDPGSNIMIVTKASLSESATSLAQGGMAAVMEHSGDSFELHISDTLRAGDTLCNQSAVRSIIPETPQRIKELVNWGASFDTNGEHGLHLALEGGHSRHRIVHRADFTGKEISAVLAKNVLAHGNITVLQNHFTVELIAGERPGGKKTCQGALVLDTHTNEIDIIYAGATVMATGGAGQAFEVTTNPFVSTGDGIAMAARIGATLGHMEFVQFHPTTLYEVTEGHAFLISEAVRGAGSILRNRNGERFMLKYDDRAELASRDIVSRAICAEMELTSSRFVFLDCRLIPADEFAKHFPTILHKCLSRGIDPACMLIPVRPGAHYLCGGIRTDLDGRTDIGNLYAVGECAFTGLHGANRLASNSLTEALVMAARSSAHLRERPHAMAQHLREITIPVVNQSTPEELSEIRNAIRENMQSIAVICSNEKIKRALWNLDHIYERLETLRNEGINRHLLETENMLYVGKQILHSSLKRKQNYGAFYKTNNTVPEIQHKTDFNLSGI